MIIEPTPEHEAARLVMIEVCRKYKNLSAPELLAIAAQLVGQLIAGQDQTKHSVGEIIDMVNANIEVGNQAALESLMTPEGEA